MKEEKTLMMLVGAVFREWREYTQGVAGRVGISDAYRPVVIYLSRHPGAGQKEIADFHGVSGAAISRTVKDMLRDGYLRRETDAEDGRCARLYLTDRGLAASAYVRDILHGTDALITEALTPGKEAELRAALGTVRAVIREERKKEGELL